METNNEDVISNELTIADYFFMKSLGLIQDTLEVLSKKLNETEEGEND